MLVTHFPVKKSASIILQTGIVPYGTLFVVHWYMSSVYYVLRNHKDLRAWKHAGITCNQGVWDVRGYFTQFVYVLHIQHTESDPHPQYRAC